MENNVFLSIVHLGLMREWLQSLDEDKQNEIQEKFPSINQYLGLEMYGIENENKLQEFKIVNHELWLEAKKNHIFLNAEISIHEG